MLPGRLCYGLPLYSGDLAMEWHAVKKEGRLLETATGVLEKGTVRTGLLRNATAKFKKVMQHKVCDLWDLMSAVGSQLSVFPEFVIGT
jgi:hypothetical protein